MLFLLICLRYVDQGSDSKLLIQVDFVLVDRDVFSASFQSDGTLLQCRVLMIEYRCREERQGNGRRRPRRLGNDDIGRSDAWQQRFAELPAPSSTTSCLVKMQELILMFRFVHREMTLV